MFANRTVYLFSLTAAISFYFASGVWASWALVFVLLILPAVSFLCSLPQMLHLRLSLSAPPSVEQGQTLLLQLSLRAYRFLPVPGVQLRLCTSLQGERQLTRVQLTQLPRQGGTVPQTTEQAGCIRAELLRIRVYDLLGLIWLPKKAPAPALCAVLPTPQEPAQRPDLRMFRSARLTPLPAGSFSELHDHRPYRAGDNARSIHWKLSQKTGQTIVREPVTPARLQAAVAVAPPRTLQQLQSVLARLRWVSAQLLEEGVEHTVLWADGEGTQTREVRDGDSALAALIAACCMPVFGETAPVPQVPDADWTYWIRAEEAGV